MTSDDDLPVSEPLRIDAKGMPVFNRLKNTRHGVMLYDFKDQYVGRSLELYGEYNEGKIEIFRQMLKPRDIVLDVGAYIGTCTLFFSQAIGPAGTVIAFEPQRIPYQTLCANVALNSLNNVYAYNAAVGSEAGLCTVPPLDYSVENNFAAYRVGEHTIGDTVQIARIDDLELPKCDVIKVDVEGAERDVLIGAKETVERHQPHLYIGASHDEELGALLEHLLTLDYRLYWDVSRLFNEDNYFGNPNNIFGDIVSPNIVGLPPSNVLEVEATPIRSADERWHGGRELRQMAPMSTS